MLCQCMYSLIRVTDTGNISSSSSNNNSDDSSTIAIPRTAFGNSGNSKHSLRAQVVIELLGPTMWPTAFHANTPKELLFLSELEGLVEGMDESEFAAVLEPLLVSALMIVFWLQQDSFAVCFNICLWGNTQMASIRCRQHTRITYLCLLYWFYCVFRLLYCCELTHMWCL
jgi:hypothetical protein